MAHMGIKFNVDLSDSQTKIIRVTMHFQMNEKVERIEMPVWAPGSYLVRDFSRHISKISMKKGKLIQIDKMSWEIHSENKDVDLEYEVYCDELSVQTSYADDSLVIINGSSVFFYVKNRKDEEYSVSFLGVKEGEVFTGLPFINGTFVANDYDTLADSPFMYGNLKSMEFDVSGKKHIIAYYGRMLREEDKVMEDFRKIVIEEEKIFGELPYDKYIFFIVLVPDDIGGGLEHKNSTLIISNEHRLLNDFDYKLFLSTVSHEFFHTWNVKRIRPRQLGPFDYTREVYTDLLWFSEGFTSYYEWVVLARGGIVSEQEYIDHIVEMINYYNFQPGHQVRSAASSSFNTWIKLYKPDGDVVNNYISYYLKGELIGFALNCEILQETYLKRSLDDVFKLMYDDYKENGKGFDFDELLKKVISVSSPRVADILRKLVYEVDTEIFEKYLPSLGYETQRSYPNNSTSPKGFLGIGIQNNGGKYFVKYVLKDFPAFKAGINAGDEIVAINNEKYSETFVREFSKELKQVKIDDLKGYKPYQNIKIHVFRRNILKEFEIKAAEEPSLLSVKKKEDSLLMKKMITH